MKHAVKKYFLSVLLCVFVFNAFGGDIKPPKLHNKNTKVVHAESSTQSTIRFTENKNQWDKKIIYRAQLDGGLLFLEKNCFTYNFYDKETLRKSHLGGQKAEGRASSNPRGLNTQLLTQHSQIPAIRSHAFRMTFLNAEKTAEISAKQTTSDYCNFFIGNDKSKWAGNVKNYNEVNYKNLYKGISLQILGMQNSMKYNFMVAPNGNPDEIKLFYEGLDAITLEKGALKLKTSVNEIVEQKPYAYQWIDGKQVEVVCAFVLDNNTVRFLFPNGYDKKIELIIDPVLVFACSSGSIADNFGMTATYDAQGNLYSGGTVFGIGYPTTLGAYDTSWNGGSSYLAGRTDVVISKYDSSGTFMRYSTYLGGTISTEIVSSLIVNAQNELMLFGATGSSDFPVTAGAFDVTFNGGTALSFTSNGTIYSSGTDIYVAKFNSTGTSLLASTFIGGSQNDGVNDSPTLAYNYGDYYRGEIQVDSLGNCYIASCTYSSNFPTTVGCSQPTPGGGMDGVVFKMNPNLSAMMWSTYLGGSADDGCYALTLDNSLNIYTTGGTSSTNFPITAGALSTVYNGGITDGYVTKIKNDGSSILKSTFIGTNAYDQSFLIQLDNNFDVYIVGQTLGVMPVSGGVYSNPNSKQFIWKMNNTLSAQLFTTIFGSGSGQVDISPSAFLVDICGNILVSGWGGNVLTGVPTTNMPVTSNAFQSTTDGFNFYLFELSPGAASFLYGTYFGGPLSWEHVDGGTSRFDKKGIVYQAVCANCGGWNAGNQHDDFPVTPGSWPNTGSDVNHNTQNYNCNQGVFKFNFQVPPPNANFTVNSLSGCAPYLVNFTNTSTSWQTYLWDFGNGNTSSSVFNPSQTYTIPGTYQVKLIVNNGTCHLADTSIILITVNPLPAMTSTNTASICTGGTVTIPLTSDLASAYSWVAADNLNTTGESITIQTGSPLSNTITNNSTSVQSVLYSVIPISTVGGCAGTPQNVIVTVIPTPIMTSLPSATICSGGTVNVPLTSNVSSTYSWVAADNINTIGESTTTQTGSPLNNTITNNTASAEIVNYTVTPTSSPLGCAGTPQALAVTVNPLPTMTSPNSATICSGGRLNIPLTSNNASTFSWVAVSNPNTNGESTTSQNGSPLNDSIFNNTTSVQTIIYNVTPTSNPEGCAGTPQTLTVTANPAASMTSPNSATICSGGTINIPLASNFPSPYTWIAIDNVNTTGESTTQQVGSPLNNTITNNSTSVQSVIYTVTPIYVSGICPGIPQTLAVTVIPTPIITNPIVATVCSGGTVSITLTSNFTSTYSWIAADNPNTTGESITTQTGSPLINTITNISASVETVSYTVTPTSNPEGCVGTPKGITVTVNPAPVMTSPTSATICSGGTVSILLTSNIASTFTWIATNNPNTTGESTATQTGSPLSNIIINNTTAVETVTYMVTPTSTPEGCAGAPQTVTITVNPGPNMTSPNSATICTGGTVNIPLTSTMASSYTWVAADNLNTTGESTTLQTGSPLTDAITNSSASVQSVVYTVTPSSIAASCLGTPQIIIVSVIPLPTITSPPADSICSGGTINIPLTSNVSSTYSWVATDNVNTTGESTTIQTGGTLNNSITNNTTSVQTVSYSIIPTSSPSGCAGTPQTTAITVFGKFTADFDFVKVPCTNQVTFHDSSAVGPVSWLWYFADGDSSTLQNPVHTYAAIGTYNARLIATTINGCKDTVVVQVNLASTLPVLISADTTICKGNHTQLIASGGVSYRWLPVTGLSNPAISNPIASPDTTITYTVSIVTVDMFGDTCLQNLTATVKVVDLSLYSLFATVDKDTLIQGQSTLIHAIADLSLTVNWLPPVGLSNSHVFNPTAAPESTTTYTVSILDSVGCPKTATVTVYVVSKKCNADDVFVPNTFTPNGDGVNDVLYVRGNEIKELYFAVYNRWGEMIFETTDITKGWNGIYKGMKVDPAVFAWYMKAKCFNGEEMKKQGNVTLMR